MKVLGTTVRMNVCVRFKYLQKTNVIIRIMCL